MKKFLLGTTAVVAAATFAGQSNAADKIDIGVSGFVKAYYHDTDHEKGTQTNEATIGLGQHVDSEVHFSGSTTLDNGLTVGVKVELESAQGTAAGDYTSISISSDSMGTLETGMGFSSGAAKTKIGAPTVGPWGFGDAGDYATNNAGAWAYTANHDNMGDADMLKTRYTTPNFSGFVASVSYAANEQTAFDTRKAARSGTHEEKSLGLGWSGEFSGASVGVSAGYNSIQNSQDVLMVGAKVGMAGFTVAGNYADIDDDQNTNGGALTTLDTRGGKSWELGVGYATGPYNLAVAYHNAEADGTRATAGDDEDTEWTVGASYNMGGGVSLIAQYWDAEADAEGTTAAIEANGIIAGVEVSF